MNKEQELTYGKKYPEWKSLAPSGFQYWSECLGYLESKSSRSSEAAKKGKKAHEDMYERFKQHVFFDRNYKSDDPYVKYVIELANTPSVNKVGVEMEFYRMFPKYKCYTVGYVDYICF